MATDNPKVSGYVPQVVYDQLMQFKAERGLKSVSMAVTAVLEEYFGLSKAPIGDATASRLETLEDKVTSLTETVMALSQAIASIQSSSGLPVTNSQLSATASSLLLESLSNHSETNQSNPPIADSELLIESTLPETTVASSPQVDQEQPPTTEVSSPPVGAIEPPDQTAASSSLIADREPIESSPLTDQRVNSSPLANNSELHLVPVSSPQVEESEPYPARRDSAVEGIATTEVQVEESTLPLPTAVSNPSGADSEPRSRLSRQPLTQAALAKRLGVNSSRISRIQSQANFPKWSQERDPDGIAWKFNSKSKRFYPHSRE